MFNLNVSIENLVLYGKKNLGLCNEDVIYARNMLFDLFKTTFTDAKPDCSDLQKEILDPLVAYALSTGMISEGEELIFETKLMNFVSPSPGLVVKTFEEKKSEEGIESATGYIYNIAVNSNYIRMNDIKKNICWYADGKFGEIGITINLAKPEKDAKQVLAEKNFTGVKYPRCLLCIENIGFGGNAVHPARQTLRPVPISLNKENWHVQYSPFVYYDEHCIAFSDNHVPMKITDATFTRLIDFVDIFPHYFIGSNADLPIVGGSILAHEHYQGGKKVLPMFLSRIRSAFYKSTKTELSISVRDWYNSVISIRGGDKAAVEKAACQVTDLWKRYSDRDAGILCMTDSEPHNTVTPIATKNAGQYCIDLILRNNRTDEKHPFGIYHPTEDMHNIKKEGIGLIEAMGLFILPGRLKAEISQIISKLSARDINLSEISEDKDLGKHLGLIAELSMRITKNDTTEEIRDMVIDYVSNTCLRILECTAVFKNTEDGQNAFKRFTEHIAKNLDI